MTHAFLVTTICVIATALMFATTSRAMAKEATDSVYQFSVKDIDGKDVSLDRYKGEVLLIVNVASQCGLTKPTYPPLEELYRKYKDKGFKVLAFPANNFGAQEPGSNASIKEFCHKTFDVSFDLFAKVSVKGSDQCPLYKFLTTHPDKKIAGDVAWNFQKYLVGRDGKVIAMFGPRTLPNDKSVVEQVEKALAAKVDNHDS